MEPIRVQGRTLTGDDLRELRGLMAQHPGWHRTGLSVHLCQLWNWRNAAGQIKDMAARTLLLKLAARGLIDLPPPRRRPSRPCAQAPPVDQEQFLALRARQVQDTLARLQPIRLELADTRLPQLVSRLREGEQVDVDTEVPPLDHGTDELGQVADAFNKAQHTAVAAAVAEAETRKGVNAVFLNLAHRSQVVVHRQLEVLDKAEYNQEDPEQLELLFQLDNLATRARRNAENLVILGGEQPRRQWRNPVALSEIVRSAAAETEEYARIRITRLPRQANPIPAPSFAERPSSPAGAAKETLNSEKP